MEIDRRQRVTTCPRHTLPDWLSNAYRALKFPEWFDLDDMDFATFQAAEEVKHAVDKVTKERINKPAQNLNAPASGQQMGPTL